MMTQTQIIELAQDAGAEWSDFGRIQFESEDDLVNFFDRALKTKKWVGLTLDEMHQLNDALNLEGRFPIIETIEAKLKEKNT
jgi:hypothetical protein